MKTQWALSSLLLVAVVAFATGCDDSSNGNGNGDSADNGGSGGEPGEGFAALQGTWESECHQFDPLDPAEDSIRLVITRVIDGDQAEQTNEVYDVTNTSCSGQPQFTANFTWQYTVGDSFTTTDGTEAYPIDVTVVSDPQDVLDYDEQFDIFQIDEENGIAYFSENASETAEDRPDTINGDVRHYRIAD